MNKLIYVSLFFLMITACNNNAKKKSLNVTVESIDTYVAEKLDTSQNYTILTGLRFSKENDTYAAVQFSQNDTVILCTEEHILTSGILFRNIFYQDDLPVFVEEYEEGLTSTAEVYTERKIYFNGAAVIKAFERSAATEEELIDMPYQEITTTMSDFDFNKPKDAVRQQGDFEMKFGEFLIFDNQSYLVLENENSGFNVALFIIQGDPMIDELYSNPEKYKVKTIFTTHEFHNIAGLDRVVYTGGKIIE